MPPAIDSDEFSKDIKKHFRNAKRKGPLVVTDGPKTVGVIMSQDEYQALLDAATGELLRKRLASKGPFFSHAEAERRILAAARGEKT
jgi:PHD/YefM family antitoxin component YafN of YafNO toxin-antitoxin module